MTFLESQLSQALVAHACNPSYSGGRDQEDTIQNQPQENSSQDPLLRKHNAKQSWWSSSSSKSACLTSIKPWVQTPKPQRKKKKASYPFLSLVLVKCYFCAGSPVNPGSKTSLWVSYVHFVKYANTSNCTHLAYHSLLTRLLGRDSYCSSHSASPFLCWVFSR
jgi:hypothetical protein